MIKNEGRNNLYYNTIQQLNEIKKKFVKTKDYIEKIKLIKKIFEIMLNKSGVNNNDGVIYYLTRIFGELIIENKIDSDLIKINKLEYDLFNDDIRDDIEIIIEDTLLQMSIKSISSQNKLLITYNNRTYLEDSLFKSEDLYKRADMKYVSGYVEINNRKLDNVIKYAIIEKKSGQNISGGLLIKEDGFCEQLRETIYNRNNHIGEIITQKNYKKDDYINCQYDTKTTLYNMTIPCQKGYDSYRDIFLFPNTLETFKAEIKRLDLYDLTNLFHEIFSEYIEKMKKLHPNKNVKTK